MRLNLGSGANLFEGWLNVDIDDVEETYLRHLRSAQNVDGWPEWQRRQWEFLRGGGVFKFQRYDFTKKWRQYATNRSDRLGPFYDVEAIYLGQVVEHLNPLYELPALLKQCHKVLKPGGVLRLTTPCFDKILTAWMNDRMGDFAPEQPPFYALASNTQQLSYLLFGATGPNSTRSNYEGHMHIWTPSTLEPVVREAGFTGEIDFSWPSKRLPDVRDFGESHSFALEVCKT